MIARRIVVGLLATGLLIYGFLYIYPLIAPAFQQSSGTSPHNPLAALLLSLVSPHSESVIASYFPAVLLGTGVVMLVIVAYDVNHRPRRTHGSANYASRRQARKFAEPRFPLVSSRPGKTVQTVTTSWTGGEKEFRLLLGTYHGTVIALSLQQQYEHVLLTGRSGGGKSSRFFIPNLLRERGARSLFIADLKGDLYDITAGWLASTMQVWLFAPMRSQESQGYNPLAYIRSVADAQEFAATWITNTGTSGGKDTFWETSSKLLIAAIVLHLVATEKSPAFSRLADILTTQSYEQIRDILTTTRSRDARYMARQFLENMEKNERQIASQMTDIGNRFQLLASPEARAVTAINTIGLDEMIDTPTAFFLSIPLSDTERYQPLIATLVKQMITIWQRRKTEGMICYLDEFANIGYIPGFSNFISTARSLRVSLLMGIQNFSQLDALYGHNVAETIRANAATHLLLPGGGLQETKYYSERIGDTTVTTWTTNRRGSGLSEEITSSEGETRRRLMMPEELRTMPADQMLMLEATSPPLLLNTRQYFTVKSLNERANWPHHVTHVRPEPPPPPQYPQGLPPASRSSSGRRQQPDPDPPVIVDADMSDTIIFPEE